MAGTSNFLSPNVGVYSLKKSLHLLYREAIVDVRESARMGFVMYFVAWEFLKDIFMFSVKR